MKKSLILLFLIAPLCTILGQELNLKPAPEDKAVVYFVRPGANGAIIGFNYFDGTKYIGSCGGLQYIRYECEPGKHVFWGGSENRDYVEAELSAGKNYVIEVIPKLGAVVARIALEPVDLKIYKKGRIKSISKLLNRKDPKTFDPTRLTQLELEMATTIKLGMTRYEKLVEMNKEINQLTPDMSVD